MNIAVARLISAAFLAGGPLACFAVPINLLANPGFETGNFSGWVVGGNSIQVGVAIDGTAIPNADIPFPPNFQNVRSGTFAGNALIKDGFDPVERIILSQTVAVSPNQNVAVGFWMGNDSGSAFGVTIDSTHTQIFIDGIGLLANSFLNIPPGANPGNFIEFSGSFSTGGRTSITVAFAINGSGTSRVGASFDDFRFVSESPVAIPEPATLALLVLSLAGIGLGRRRKGSR